MDRLRVWLAALVLAVPPAAIALSWAALAPRLPDTIATHWSGADVADGFSDTAATGTALLAVTGGMLVIALVLAALPVGERLRATILSLLAALSGVLAAAWIASAVTTAEAGVAERAVLGWWLLLVIGGVALMVVPWLVHPREAVTTHQPAVPIPLSPTASVSWSGTASTSLFLWLALLLVGGAAVLMLVLPIADSPVIGIGTGIVLLAAAACIAALSRIRVTVDESGLRVRSAVLGIPLRSVPSERIRIVEALEIAPSEWGGWGFRALPGRVAIVLQAGPGIVVTTREGSQFAVTVDDAQAGASTLAALVERRREAEAPPRRKRPGDEQLA